MDGVTILSEMSVRGADLSRVIFGVIMVITLSVGCIMFIVNLWGKYDTCYKPTTSDKFFTIFGIIYAMSFYLFLMLFPISAFVEYGTFHTEYVVEINDSVGFNEFYNHYDIISQDGDIYTVREVDE